MIPIGITRTGASHSPSLPSPISVRCPLSLQPTCLVPSNRGFLRGTGTRGLNWVPKCFNSEQPVKKSLVDAFQEIKLPERYGLWSQDIKTMLFRETNLSVLPFVPTKFITKYPVPDVHEMCNIGAYAFQSLADRFKNGDIDGMLPHVGFWLGELLKKWQTHCETRNQTWSLSPRLNLDKFYISTNAIGRAILVVDNNIKPDQLKEKVKTITSNNVLRELIRTRKESGISVYAVFWVHIVAEESFVLSHKETNEQLFASPEYRPNHHVWKIGAQIPPPSSPVPLEWKVLDIEGAVRKNLLQLGSPSFVLDHFSEVDLIPYWQATVI